MLRSTVAQLTPTGSSIQEGPTTCKKCGTTSRLRILGEQILEHFPEEHIVRYWKVVVVMNLEEKAELGPVLANGFKICGYLFRSTGEECQFGKLWDGRLSIMVTAPKERECRTEALKTLDERIAAYADKSFGDYDLNQLYKEWTIKLCESTKCGTKTERFEKIIVMHDREFADLVRRVEKILSEKLEARGIAWKLFAKRGIFGLQALPPKDAYWKRWKLFWSDYTLSYPAECGTPSGAL